MDGGDAVQSPSELSRGGEGRSPLLALDGFSGPLEQLLVLARAHEVDLTHLSLRELVAQLTGALEQAVPLAEKTDWVVMTAWLVLLRSNLLKPSDPPAQHAAEAEADRLRDRLIELQHMQALATWLEHRSQLGRDVFARGQPELLGITTETTFEVDVIEFLWAALALFDEAGDPADTTEVYRPRWRDLHSIPQARDRILRLLAETSQDLPFEDLVPKASSTTDAEVPSDLRNASGWTSTFVASLELAKQGKVVLAQEGFLTPIYVGSAPQGPTGLVSTGQARSS